MPAPKQAVSSAKSYEIVVIEADGSTSVIPIGVGQSTIGSDASCQVLIADASVAPRHAEILLTNEGGLYLRDLAGQHSTLVNGQVTERSPLEDGAFIKVGLVDLSIRERGGASGQFGTMIRDSGLMPGVGGAVPPPAVTPLRQSTVQRAYKAGNSGPVPPVPAGGTVPGIRPASLSGLPTGHLTLEDDPEEGSDPTYMRGVQQLEHFGPGQTIGERYKIIAKLAEGGMGEVYRAEHIQLEMQVAIKVMKRELGDDAAFVDRFTREAKAASRIGQQNICGVTDMARTPAGQFYFVMEFLDGQTLGQLIRDRGALPAAQAINIFMQLCQALASAHHAGIVHRDLKPENVMILQRPGQKDFVKVLDFGVAKIRTSPSDSGQTQMGMVVGTPQYMAPEQASGLLTDARTDIYALGLIFYEMLAGKPTFSESTAALLMAAQIYRTPAPLTYATGDAMPPHVQDFVMHMLQKKAENRPQTMEEVITALQSLQEAFKSPVKLLATPAYTPPVRPSDVAALIESDKRKIAAGKLPGGISGIKLKPPSSGRHKASAMPPNPGAIPQGDTSPTDVGGDSDFQQLQASQGPNKGLIIGGVAALVLLGIGGVFAFGGKEQPATVLPPIVEIRPDPPKPVPEPPKPVAAETPKPAAPAKVKLTLKSEPPGAEIHRDGAMIGSTPMDIQWEQDKSVKLQFKLTGYKDFEKVMAPAGDMTIDAKLTRAGGSGGGPKKPKPGKDLADDPYGGQTEDLKEAEF